MTASKSERRAQVFGTGLIALDLVVSADPASSVKSWTGGTCGNVLAIMAYLGWDAFPIARMNGDPASERVKADLRHWGVRLDFAACTPTTHTPIIIQEIRRARDGSPTHRFSWSCPRCGSWLPGFKAVTAKSVEAVAPSLSGASVFFMDRLSRAALLLAQQAAGNGALVVFEPSGRADPKLLAEALRLAHIVKYADQRLGDVAGVFAAGAATLVEVQTLGSEGLRFRHRLASGMSNWERLEAVPAPHLADSCGSGDWCTAGLLALAAKGGQEGLRQGGDAQLREALRYGQALAAWNCGFEGARGGMYAVERSSFDRQIRELLAGRAALHRAPAPRTISGASEIACPACPH